MFVEKARESLARARMLAELVRWLGPWGPEERVPSGVHFQVRELSPNATYSKPLQVHVYSPANPLGIVLVTHGLHPHGPSDPRLARFLRRLAGSGLLVWAPALNEYMGLRLDEQVIPCLQRAMEGLLAWRDRPRTKVGVFSISFGSLPTLRLAAKNDLGGVILYGGYTDFRATMRFALGADLGRTRDPLNPPAIYINLARHFHEVPQGLAVVEKAWHDFSVQTWGRPHMKDPANMRVVVDSIAASLIPEHRELFIQGCGLGVGGLQRCEEAIERVAQTYAFLDPRPHFATIRAPITILHGRNDDVIPSEQANVLYDALTPHTRARRYLTGLYGHAGSSKTTVGALVEESTALLSMMRGLVLACTQRERSV